VNGVRVRLAVVADDLTGACDVGGELAEAGHDVRVLADATAPWHAGPGLTVANTQSRALPPAEAATRVRSAVARDRADVLLKKIDTALRGHLGAELAAALEASGVPAAFVVAAIPGAGRVTRGGCQWFDGRLLAETEFAHDPEGPAAGTSSIPAVLATECAWPSAVIDVATVRAGRLGTEAGSLLDAESDGDVEAAVDAILALPAPHCLAGSVALARALARQIDVAGPGRPSIGAASTLPRPTLFVSGSLHSRARAQLDALVTAGLGDRIAASGDVAAAAARTRALLDGGRNVVIAPDPAAATPPAGALRDMEDRLAALTHAVVTTGRVASLVLIGGETSYAILHAIGASELALHGRPALLLARSQIVTGPAGGTVLITKGGSGGDINDLKALLQS
jgi:uncharacterized protein YgbK (DUF1537 family)